MESFGRIVSILITVFLIFFIPISRRFSFEIDRNLEMVENRLNELYEKIRSKHEITSSELLNIYELASAVGAKLQITVGMDRDIVVPEDNYVYKYREYMYNNDIEQIIAEEGKFVLLSGDTLSLSASVKKRFPFGGIFEAGRSKTDVVTAGGII